MLARRSSTHVCACQSRVAMYTVDHHMISGPPGGGAMFPGRPPGRSCAGVKPRLGPEFRGSCQGLSCRPMALPTSPLSNRGAPPVTPMLWYMDEPGGVTAALAKSVLSEISAAPTLQFPALSHIAAAHTHTVRPTVEDSDRLREIVYEMNASVSPADIRVHCPRAPGRVRRLAPRVCHGACPMVARSCTRPSWGARGHHCEDDELRDAAMKTDAASATGPRL